MRARRRVARAGLAISGPAAPAVGIAVAVGVARRLFGESSASHSRHFLSISLVLYLDGLAQHLMGFFRRDFPRNGSAHARCHRFLPQLLLKVFVTHAPDVSPVNMICQFRGVRKLTL